MQWALIIAFLAALGLGAAAIRENGAASCKAEIQEKTNERLKVNAEWSDYARTENERAATALETAQATIAAKSAALEKERARNVPQNVVDACVVNRGFVLHLNAAAAGMPGVYDAAGRTVGEPANVGLDSIAGSVAGNYDKCRQDAERFRRLVDRIREICRDYSKRYGHNAAGCEVDAGTVTGKR